MLVEDEVSPMVSASVGGEEMKISTHALNRNLFWPYPGPSDPTIADKSSSYSLSRLLQTLFAAPSYIACNEEYFQT